RAARRRHRPPPRPGPPSPSAERGSISANRRAGAAIPSDRRHRRHRREAPIHGIGRRELRSAFSPARWNRGRRAEPSASGRAANSRPSWRSARDSRAPSLRGARLRFRDHSPFAAPAKPSDRLWSPGNAMKSSVHTCTGPTRQPRLRVLIPLVIGCAFFMEGLDSTMIAVAIPDMAKSLDEHPLRLNLVITSYLLSLAVFIPLSGWIADRLGARVVFCAAIAIFATGSALCGLSTSLPMMLLMRVVQGFGGAMMTPVGRLILLRSFPRS